MPPVTPPAVIAALDEAIELGEPAEIVALIASLGDALAGERAEREVERAYTELAAAGAGQPLDRQRCQTLLHRLRGDLIALAARVAAADAPRVASVPVPVVPPDVVADLAVLAGPLPASPGAASAEVAPAEAPRWTVAEDSQDMLRDFAVEARGLLDQAEQAFLALESEVNADDIATAFRAFHTIKGVAGFLELDVLAGLAHRTESLLAEVRDGLLPAGPCVDVVLRGVDHTRALIDCALRGAAGDLAAIAAYDAALAAASAGAHAPPAASAAPPPAHALVAAAPPTAHAPGAAAPPSAPAPTAAAPPPAPAPGPAARPAARAPAPAAAPRRDEDAGTVKVETHKMDQLVDLVGELAIAQAQLASDPSLAALSAPSLLRAKSSLARVARELQRAALAMRMVAIRGTFDRMARVARDTARTLGKPIAFTIEGAQTELDRTMVEAIYDPLVHLVRNAIDHGIEGTIERARRGKPAAGTLTLRAYHHAGQVVVEIVDDGGGLDQARILERARSRGLVSPEAQLTADEIHHLIFLPGFSTAAKVTEVSGRGVGMDVVKTNIERVRGRVEIESAAGRGTTIRLKLPLTLAIIDGLLIGVGDERYVLPATWAREIFRPRPEQVVTVQGRGELVKLRGTLYPVHRLGGALGVPRAGDGDGIMIMVEHGARPVCLEVDRLLGKQEVVVKGLGAMFAGTPGVAGGAILGDGRIALILDIPTLLGGQLALPERHVA
jgi:two-component system chemotaxis sensor kinase CheA